MNSTQIVLFLWVGVGGGRFAWYFYLSRQPGFWDEFPADQRAFFQANMWFFDAVGFIWSLIAGPLYLVSDIYRWVYAKM